MRGRRVLAVVGLAAAVAGCSARSSTAVADARTAMRVRTALVNDAVLGARPIDVQVRAQVVTLTGVVRSSAERDLAGALARGAAGGAVVEVALTIDAADPAPAARTRHPGPRLSALAPRPGPPRRFAVGAGLRLFRTGSDALGPDSSPWPIVRFRPGRGFGPAIEFNWATVDYAAGGPAVAEVRLRPVLGGIGYGVVAGRVAASASIVAGASFNGVRTEAARVAAGRGYVTRVSHSLAWQPGVAVWIDVARRLSLTLTAGYLVTRPEVTFSDDAGLDPRSIRADTAVIGIGAAYWIF